MDTAVNTPLRFVIRSELAEIRPVQSRILEEVTRRHFGPNSTFAIKLSLEEALINAVKHGNRLDPGKMVRVQATITPEQAEIIVEDEGCGFDRSCVPDPTADENLQKLHGRGIMLMEAYMDEIQWSCKGRRVRMVRRNDT
jgi:serine/threonine-protein kinase RsbW